MRKYLLKPSLIDNHLGARLVTTCVKLADRWPP